MVRFSLPPSASPPSLITPTCPLYRALDARGLAFLPFGVAAQPNFEAFFGGLEAAVAAGAVLVIACVVVLAIRRLTSF